MKIKPPKPEWRRLLQKRVALDSADTNKLDDYTMRPVRDEIKMGCWDLDLSNLQFGAMFVVKKTIHKQIWWDVRKKIIPNRAVDWWLGWGNRNPPFSEPNEMGPEMRRLFQNSRTWRKQRTYTYKSGTEKDKSFNDKNF